MRLASVENSGKSSSGLNVLCCGSSDFAFSSQQSSVDQTPTQCVETSSKTDVEIARRTALVLSLCTKNTSRHMLTNVILGKGYNRNLTILKFHDVLSYFLLLFFAKKEALVSGWIRSPESVNNDLRFSFPILFEKRTRNSRSGQRTEVHLCR